MAKLFCLLGQVLQPRGLQVAYRKLLNDSWDMLLCHGITHLSEPARSTKDSLPLVTFCVCRLVASMMTDMMRCEREDSRFICVEDTCRRCCPFSMVASSSRADVTCITAVFFIDMHSVAASIYRAGGTGHALQGSLALA